MSKYTKEDIIRLVREGDVEFIRMQFTDIFGQLKNVAITASQIEKAVNNQIMIDGSSIEGFVRINESDQYLWPDLDTFAILPGAVFTQQRVNLALAQLQGDVVVGDNAGKPLGNVEHFNGVWTIQSDLLLTLIKFLTKTPFYRPALKNSGKKGLLSKIRGWNHPRKGYC